MANSLEFSPGGHPIENRYDGYGEFLADSLPSGEEGRYGDNRNDPFWYDGWTITELEAEMRTKGLLLPEQGDMEDAGYEEAMRGILRETALADDDYDPFAPVEGEDDEVTK